MKQKERADTEDLFDKLKPVFLVHRTMPDSEAAKANLRDQLDEYEIALRQFMNDHGMLLRDQEDIGL